MSIVDRVFIAFLWLRAFNARQNWRFYERLTPRLFEHPRGFRRCQKMEFLAWRQSCAAAARLARERRRIAACD